MGNGKPNRVIPDTTERHPRIVDACVRLHRALFSIRTSFEVDSKEALNIVVRGKVRHYPDAARKVKDARLCLSILRKEWPRLTDLERLDVATTVTQAASHALQMTLSRGDEERPKAPLFYSRGMCRHLVVRSALVWITQVTGTKLPIDIIVSKVSKDKVSAQVAHALTKELFRNTSHILAWAAGLNGVLNAPPDVPTLLGTTEAPPRPSAIVDFALAYPHLAVKMSELPKKGRRGFAAMDPATRKELATRGGKAAQSEGSAHKFTSEEARAAGSKGGRARVARRLSPQLVPVVVDAEATRNEG